ncbi:MAG: dipeptide epimerase [Betaproteobacteria bacterium]|jgi:L-alanine-DL-glutamate epimerase-like enolase superfamily enzyme|nr:dipeptide epimerase [Burkholderiaceae bacterium]MCZ8175994.1 dipeptide epimerase [Burkholderiaceae bacterium]
MKLKCEAVTERWALSEPLEISTGILTHIDTVHVRLEHRHGHAGRGEAAGVSYDGETASGMVACIEELAGRLHEDLGHDELARWLPPGGARNALDCALWDLRAKRSGRRAWELAGLPAPQPVTTSWTIGLGDEARLRRWVRAARHMPVLKLKVDATRHLDSVRIAREEHPAARLLVDANQAWTPALLEHLLPRLHEAGVELVEQPLPRHQDALLEGLRSPIPLAADESCTDAGSLPALVGRYQVVNIKLDKCGGLHEALRVLHRARELGLQAMVGSMGGTSLAAAPAMLVAQQCRFVDLDAPLLLARDREHPLPHDGARLVPSSRELWG